MLREWIIVEAKQEIFQALNTNGIGYILKLKRKILWFWLYKTCKSILPYSFNPEPGKILKG
ncbi:hypothetical protein KAR91_67405 [Candidatus Pacearchaeota archaeon]|nr:hypothetical protein [Candidatus Pacearchaeota archaeon]